ncbi:glycosyltransferase [Pontimonas sp.]|nr:glycosyltransferase [Pontimonas sp.]
MSSSVLHVNFSRSGGAGAVARVLHEEQLRQGMNSAFRHVIDSDLRSKPLSSPLHTVAAGLDQYLLKSPSFSAPISVFRERVTTSHPLTMDGYDIVHLHGVSGALSQKDWTSLRNARKVVWTLHDMNPFTGACHYSLGCNGYTTGCSSCPAVRTLARPTVAKAWETKRDRISSLANLSVVAPSDWLLRQASASGILGDQSLVVQHNPIQPVFCEPPERRDHDQNGLVAIVVAKNLDDDVKNVAQAVSAVKEARQQLKSVTLILVGQGGHGFAGPGIELSGALSASQLKDVFSRSDVLIVPSLAENAPLVIPEAAAQGVTPFVANVGGMPGLIDALGHGRVFSSTSELVGALVSAASTTVQTSTQVRETLRTAAVSQFSPEAVVAAYAKVYA